MSERHTTTETNDPTNEPIGTNWAVEYEVEPIRIRDPVAEALAVLDHGEPFVVDYDDVVLAAGHSCPTAAGAFRITQLGLDALYPDGDPVRGEIAVRAGGPRSDPTYGVLSRLVSFVTGAAEEDGFGGLAGGYGDRRDLLRFGDHGAESPTFVFQRTDSEETVRVTYHIEDVPSPGEATAYLPKLVDGTATPDERAAFADAWHGRVRTVLSSDEFFEVDRVDGVDVAEG